MRNANDGSRIHVNLLERSNAQIEIISNTINLSTSESTANNDESCNTIHSSDYTNDVSIIESLIINENVNLNNLQKLANDYDDIALITDGNSDIHANISYSNSSINIDFFCSTISSLSTANSNGNEMRLNINKYNESLDDQLKSYR